jgi:hypothetical protein
MPELLRVHHERPIEFPLTDFRFEHIGFRYPETAGDNHRELQHINDVDQHYFCVVDAGQVYDLQAKHFYSQPFGDRDSRLSDHYEFILMMPQTDVVSLAATLKVTYDPADKHPDAFGRAEASVMKKRGFPISGMAMYEKVLDFIPSLARRLQIPIDHAPRRLSEYHFANDPALPLRDWEHLFQPVLERHGYTPQRNALYYKTYQP